MAIKNNRNLTFCKLQDVYKVVAGESGFTMVEMLVYLVISSMVAGAVGMAFVGQNKSYNTQQEISKVQQNIRAATSLMGNELRYAAFDPTDGKLAGFTTVNSNSVTFSYLVDSDSDADFDTDDDLRRVTYSLNGSNIERRVEQGAADNTSVLAENVEQLQFEYLLDDQTTWEGSPADPDAVIAVKVIILGITNRTVATNVDAGQFVPSLEENGVVDDWSPGADDGFGRRMVSIVVQCRNQGV